MTFCARSPKRNSAFLSKCAIGMLKWQYFQIVLEPFGDMVRFAVGSFVSRVGWRKDLKMPLSFLGTDSSPERGSGLFAPDPFVGWYWF
jgi:hypothetical protein